ncbi:MAG: pyridoxine 5'-phosphate synthase [Pseudomonadota bacterium]
MLLGVNIDHVATLRQARGTSYPSPLDAALIAEEAGSDSITIHLREDRRHILDADVVAIKEKISIPLNLEMAMTNEMLDIAIKVKPEYCCIVPERREELTTEGGLNVYDDLDRITEGCQRLKNAGIQVSLFIDARSEQIEAAVTAGAPFIEIHTGKYADAGNHEQSDQELQTIKDAAMFANEIGLQVNAGHGLNYDNVKPIAMIAQIRELNIGHSIIARSVFVGLPKAIRELKALIDSVK